MVASIDIKLAQNESYVFWLQHTCLEKFLTTLVFHPWCFESTNIRFLLKTSPTY